MAYGSSVIVYLCIITAAIKLHRFWAKNCRFTLFQQPVKPAIKRLLDNGFLDNPE